MNDRFDETSFHKDKQKEAESSENCDQTQESESEKTESQIKYDILKTCAQIYELLCFDQKLLVHNFKEVIEKHQTKLSEQNKQYFDSKRNPNWFDNARYKTLSNSISTLSNPISKLWDLRAEYVNENIINETIGILRSIIRKLGIKLKDLAEMNEAKEREEMERKKAFRVRELEAKYKKKYAKEIQAIEDVIEHSPEQKDLLATLFAELSYKLKSKDLIIGATNIQLKISEGINVNLFKDLNPKFRTTLANAYGIKAGMALHQGKRGSVHRLKISHFPHNIVARVTQKTIYPEDGGPPYIQITVRYFPPELMLSKEQGHTDYVLQRLDKYERSTGVLVVGAPCNGKSTLNCSSIVALAQAGYTTITIESPKEQDLTRHSDNIQQSQHNPGAGQTYSNFLENFIKENPDVAMIGEITNDKDTVATLEAFSTIGVMYFATMHAKDVADIIKRLKNLKFSMENVTGGKFIVVGTTLARRKEKAEEKEKKQEVGDIAISESVHLTAYELSTMREIAEKNPSYMIKVFLIEKGMIPKCIDAMVKAKQGLITDEEAEEKAPFTKDDIDALNHILNKKSGGQDFLHELFLRGYSDNPELADELMQTISEKTPNTQDSLINEFAKLPLSSQDRTTFSVALNQLICDHQQQLSVGRFSKTDFMKDINDLFPFYMKKAFMPLFLKTRKQIYETQIKKLQHKTKMIEHVQNLQQSNLLEELLILLKIDSPLMMSNIILMLLVDAIEYYEPEVLENAFYNDLVSFLRFHFHLDKPEETIQKIAQVVAQITTKKTFTKLEDPDNEDPDNNEIIELTQEVTEGNEIIELTQEVTDDDEIH